RHADADDDGRRDQGDEPDLRLLRGGRVVEVHDQVPVVSPGHQPRPVHRQRGEHEREEVDRGREDPRDVQRRAIARREAREEGAHSRPAASTLLRNAFVRCSWGSPKIWLGGPSSRITPESRKQILFATSRAKFISCVAMIIVIPTSVRSRTSCRTSLTSCGSSTLVISSSSISFGSIARARTIATRCCCPPERRSGNSWALSSSPMRLSNSYARA